MVLEFRGQGYAVIADVLTPDRVAQLRAEAGELISQFTDLGHRSDDYWSFQRPDRPDPVLYRIHNLERQGANTLADLHRGGELHGLAESILGLSVRSTACALIVKMPQVAARVPWHRDRTAAPPHTVCNLSVFLDDSTMDSGCLEFVPQSHLLPDDVDVDQVRAYGPVRAVPANAGDVLVHDVRVVHSSRPNGTSVIRRSIVIEFAPHDFVLPGVAQ